MNFKNSRFIRGLNPLNDNTERFSPRDALKSLARGGAVGLVAGGVYGAFGALYGDNTNDIARYVASGAYYGSQVDFIQYTIRTMVEDILL
jgi:hypothetical protein